jgi:surfeit locus 1 family protein
MAGWRFKPRLVPTALTALLLPALIGLGFWQLDRAAQKDDALARFDERLQRQPLTLGRDGVDADRDRFRPAQAQGSWDGGRQLLVDNQVRNRTVGYHVLTPLVLTPATNGGDMLAVLVDRGWVPAGTDRSVLPEIGVSPVPEWLFGHLDHGPATGIRLGGMADGESGWPLRVQYLDFDALSQRLGYPLLPMVLRMDAALPGGYVREWRPPFLGRFGPERNRGYAFQWFALATALLVVFFVVNLKRESETDNDR